MIDRVKHNELERQVELPKEVKQQCLVPINIHSYEDKFWSYIVTKEVGHIKGVIIYMVNPCSKT